MDLFWRDTLTCPTENDYLEMVGNKTGGLFRLAVQLMMAESPVIAKAQGGGEGGWLGGKGKGSAGAGKERDYTPLVNTIGLLFQIRDDYLNLTSTAFTANKGLCEDLTEGKFSFPVIHSIRANPGIGS